MLSVLAEVADGQTDVVNGPDPQEVMREYFDRRVEHLGVEEAKRRCDVTQQMIWKLRNGKAEVTTKYVMAVTDEATASDLFAELSGVARRLAVSAKPIDAERDRLALEASEEREPPRARDATPKRPRPRRRPSGRDHRGERG